MTARIAGIVHALTGGETPPVWSLLVTVFGDLAQEEGAQISGRALGRLGETIGIKPEALRVALHRLRRDGWIESERAGRESHHSLSAQGRAQSVAATPLIYGREARFSELWLTVHESARNDEAVWVAPNVSLSAARDEGSAGLSVQVSQGTAIPDWMAAKVCPAEMMAQTVELAERLAAGEALLAEVSQLSALECCVIRVLIVHGWRRIALKAPALPDHAFPAEWRGAACRAKVAELLDAYPRVALAMLDADAAA